MSTFFTSKSDLSAVATRFLPAAPGPTSDAFVMGGTLAASIVNRVRPTLVPSVVGTPVAGAGLLTVGDVGVVDTAIPDPGGDFAFMFAMRAPNVDASSARTVRPLSNYSTGATGMYLHAVVSPNPVERLATLCVANGAGTTDDVLLNLPIQPLTAWMVVYAQIQSGAQAVLRDLTRGTSASVALTGSRAAGSAMFRLGGSPPTTDLTTLRPVDLSGLTIFGKRLPTEPEIQAAHARIRQRLIRFGHLI